MAQASRTFSSELSQLAILRDFVGAICRQEWPNPSDEPAIRQLLLALQEAGANVIEHAYRGQPGQPIGLALESLPDQISITLSHRGLAFDSSTAVPPEFDGSREGGFGVYMMEQLADRVTYFQEDDGSWAVRLVKNRIRPSGSETWL